MTLSSCRFDHVEKVKIFNPISKENIYLKYYAWGLNNEMDVISLNRKTALPDSCKDYVLNGGAFFYKLQNDSLFLYGVWDASKLNGQKNFKTKINFVGVQNYEFIELCTTYLEKRVKVFPPTWAKFAKNY